MTHHHHNDISSQHQHQHTPAAAVCFALDKQSTKLSIPLQHIRPTIALKRTTPTPALCRLFLDGRCRQGSQCNQVHADVKIVEALRHEALAAPLCCQMHTPSGGATATPTPSAASFIVVCGEAVPVKMFCPTNGLRKALDARRLNSNDKHTATTNDLCRSHATNDLCRYGDDCNYLHLCKTLMTERTTVPQRFCGKYGYYDDSTDQCVNNNKPPTVAQHHHVSPTLLTLDAITSDESNATAGSAIQPLSSDDVPPAQMLHFSPTTIAGRQGGTATPRGHCGGGSWSGAEAAVAAAAGASTTSDSGFGGLSSLSSSAASSPFKPAASASSSKRGCARSWSHNPYAYKVTI